MFDIPSILFSLLVVEGMMALILLSFWATRFHADGLGEMTLAMTLGSVWALAGMFSAKMSDYYLAALTMAVLCCSSILAARVMRRLQGLPVRQRTEAALLIFSLPAVYFFCVELQTIPYAMATHSTVYAIIFGLAARDLLTEARPGLRSGCRFLGLIAGGTAAFHMMLIFVRPHFGNGPDVLDQVIFLDTVVIFVNMIWAICWTLGFLWTTYSSAEHQLRVAYEELDRFTSAVAHDLKSPLNAVIGNIEAANHLPAAASQDQKNNFLASAHEAALRMNGFINDLLADARAARAAPDAVTVDPHSSLTAALAGLRSQIDAVDAKVEIAPLPPVRAAAHPLTRMFQNLLDNAVKYRSLDRRLTIRVSATHANGMVRIAVADNGMGIARADQDKVFERFTRAGKQTLVQGDGLGLSECRRLAEKFGGTITLTSEPGEGSTFVIVLPAAEKT